MANLVEQNRKLIEIILRQNEEISKLLNMVSRDQLTGLYNRRYFELSNDEERNLLNVVDSSVIMFDIDNFKKVNDTYGHVIGDVVLKRVAEVISNNCRVSDIPIRYGGEEFVVLLNNCSLENAFLVADKIREKISQEVIKIGPINLNVTVSGGVSFKGVETSIENAIKEADQAMYQSKNNGKNRISKIEEKEKLNRKF